MNEITELTGIDFPSALIAFFALLAGIKAALSLLEWAVDRLGLETGWMKKNREEHDLLLRTSRSLAALQEQCEKDVKRSDSRDEEISNDIKKLTRMFVEKEIDDMRWEINNFATKVSEGRPCSKDSFTHCIRIYEKYEKILEENGLENGEVEISMELINDAYKKNIWHLGS